MGQATAEPDPGPVCAIANCGAPADVRPHLQRRPTPGPREDQFGLLALTDRGLEAQSDAILTQVRQPGSQVGAKPERAPPALDPDATAHWPTSGQPVLRGR
jgi:hypothetical protein